MADQPLYTQIKEALISDISQGKFQPGDRLPSHHALCRQFETSYMTVRRAITELIREGMVYALHGKGVYVAEPRQDAESGPLVSFTEVMARRGLTASSLILTAELIAASTVMARVLGVKAGSALVHLVRLRLADEQPIAIQTTYLPHQHCPGLLDHDLESGSLFAILNDQYNLTLASADETITAALASAEEAELLGVSLPAALLISEQITYLENGRPIEFTRAVYRGDRHQIRIT